MPKIRMLTVCTGIGDCLNTAIPNSCTVFYHERMVCLKKIACLLACCCVLSLGTLTTFAKESAVRVSEDQITLAQTQTTFEAVIEVEPENTYAGVEIAVACPEGVTVTDSSGSSGSMSAGPVLANGLYWTSFFESDNKLSGSMKITLQFSCPESFENGDVQLQTVKVLTKNGVAVNTEELSPSLKVNITRNASGVTDSDPTDSESTSPEPTTSTPSSEDTMSTEDGSSTEEINIPQTSDNSRLTTGIALLLVSGCVVLAMTIAFIKKKKFD